MKKRNSDPAGTQRVLNEINSTLLTRDEINTFVSAVAELSPDDYSFERSAITWMELFPDKREKGVSVMFRMTALAHLIQEGLPGWTISMPDGGDLTREAIFAAAAAEPVIEKDGDVAFGRDSLLRRAFQLAKDR